MSKDLAKVFNEISKIEYELSIIDKKMDKLVNVLIKSEKKEDDELMNYLKDFISDLGLENKITITKITGIK